jgi:hypothetical protein
MGSNGCECTRGFFKKELASAERVPVRDNGIGAIRRRALACRLDKLYVGGTFKKPRAHRTGACAGSLALCRDAIGAGVLIFGARSRQARSAHMFGAHRTERCAGSRHRRPCWRASWCQRRRLCCTRDGEHGKHSSAADHQDCPTIIGSRPGVLGGVCWRCFGRGVRRVLRGSSGIPEIKPVAITREGRVSFGGRIGGSA